MTTQKAVTTPICNFRSRKECLLEDQCEVGNIKYIASTSVEDDKVHLGRTKDFKQDSISKSNSL